MILDTYREQTGDSPPQPLLNFYRGYHACVRARIAIWHLDDHEDSAKWTAKAERYLRMVA
jgi:aminoglycoside phosphotransferase family enzyme